MPDIRRGLSSQIMAGLRRPPVRQPQRSILSALGGISPQATPPTPIVDRNTPPPGIPPRAPAPAAPASPGLNPYTGAPLGANEYVGVAGSEAEHPGMTRIPPPGWWDPSNPNYERRNYYQNAKGTIVAREPGFDPSEEDPWDTGRVGEINAEAESRPGYVDRRMSEPGVPRWRQGQDRPESPTYSPWNAPQATGSQTRRLTPDVLSALMGTPPTQPASQGFPQPEARQGRSDELSAFLAALLGKVPTRPRFPVS